jgi:hypothetical protein
MKPSIQRFSLVLSQSLGLAVPCRSLLKKDSVIAMPDPRSLKIGDRIRILSVPQKDLEQRERELAEKAEMAGWTANSIERIIEQSPVVRISRIDEYGCAWYETSIIGPDGTEENHSLIVYDVDTWERMDSSTD